MAGMLSHLNNPLVTMAIVFGSIQMLRFVDLTSPRTIQLLRGGYILSQMLMLLLWNWLRGKAMAVKKGTELVEVTETAAPFSGQPAKKTKMTVAEYDSLEARKQMQQVVIGSVLMLVLHFWLGMVQALVLQIILPWKSLLTQPLVQIYIFGYPATGALKRPFKQPNPFAEFMQEQTAEPASDSQKPSSEDAPRITEIKEESSSSTAEETKSSSTGSKKKKGGRKED